MIKRYLLFAALFALIIPVALLGLVSNEAGSRWLLQGIFTIVPGKIAVEKTQGRLLDHIVLNGLNYHTDSETLTVKNIDFAWQPSNLFLGCLKIDGLSISGVKINITKTKDEKNESFNLNSDIKLPIELDIGKLLITDVQFTNNGKSLTLDKLQLSAKTGNNQIKLLSLAINSQTINATATGDITLENDFPLNLQTEWQVNADKNGLWRGATTIRGDIAKLSIENHLSSPFKLTLQGFVDNALKTPWMQVQGEWQNLAWPFAASQPKIKSQHGRIEMVGLLSDYQLKINGQLDQQYAPKASFTFEGNGSLEAMTINKLELLSSTGKFQLAGNSSWGDVPSFDLTASGQQFNPAIIIPELPGSLTFNSRIKGKLDPNELQMMVDITKLSGQLRKQPFNANGKLAFNGDQLKVDSFIAALGTNKVTVDGLVGQTNGNLALSMDMPTLSTLWPTLSGSLKGRGDIHGGWKNPTVKFDAEGNHLKFADYSLTGLAVNINYHPDDQNLSTISVSANAIKSSATQIDKLSITGKGTPKQHDFNLGIHSSHGKVTTALTGNLVANTWKGYVSKLDVTLNDGNVWSLKRRLPLLVAKKPLGLDVVLDEGCLVQQDSSVCIKGSYLANTDLDFQMDAKAIPTTLIQAFLPKQVIVKSLINAKVDIQRQKNALTGRYRLDTKPIQVFISTKEALQEIRLGTSAMSGTIKDDKVSADIDLFLAGHDSLTGKLLLDTGKTQAISGNISAAIAQLSIIQAFVPQLSGIKGFLKADLALQGPIKKPLISGQIDLTEGTLDIGKTGSEQLGLRHIEFRVLASGNRSNHLQLQGSAIPMLVNKPDAPEKRNITTKINLDADLDVQDTIVGDFHLALPANTSIALVTQDTRKEIRLGATMLSGHITGEMLSADLEMALVGLDYLRGNLNIDMGKSQTLSARAMASIRDFAFIEPFVPQFSNVKGQLNADFTATGTAQNSLINGDIHLSKGAFSVEKFGLTIKEIDFQAVASSNKADVIQLKGLAKSGEGSITLDGTVGLLPDAHFPIEMALNGKDFEVAQLPEAQVTVSPDLKVVLNDQQKQVGGALAVPKANLKIQDIPEHAVKVSADEIILGEEKAESDTQKAPDINADIEVKLGKQVSFTGQGLQTNLAGNLKIIKTGEKMAMQGNVDMEKASYKRFGQDLTVRKGRFVFNGPADNPWLDVEAIRVSKSKKVTAILALTGTLKNPQTRISSEPSLPESEALAYLVTGNPLNQVSKAESNMLASAALSYGAGKATWLADKLGIDEFKVEEGSSLRDSLLVMGEYLTPDFYVGTKVGMFNKQANIVLKHKITDTINVESQAGTSQRIKLNYEFDGD